MSKYKLTAELDDHEVENLMDHLIDDRIREMEYNLRVFNMGIAGPIRNQAESDWFDGHIKYLKAIRDKIKIEKIEEEGQ